MGLLEYWVYTSSVREALSGIQGQRASGQEVLLPETRTIQSQTEDREPGLRHRHPRQLANPPGDIGGLAGTDTKR